MRCPRCGHESEEMARACSTCGFILPFALRQRRHMRDAGATMPPSVDVVVVEAAAEASDEQWEGVDAPARDEAVVVPPDLSAPGERLEAPASEDLVVPGPPQLPPPIFQALETADQPADPPSWIAGLTASPSVIPTPSTALVPVSPGLPPLASPSAGNGLERVRALPVPLALESDSQPLSGSTVVMPALNAGTLLKGGRYRLLQRFGSATITGRRGELEPPLYLASDTERPSGRVLVQELPLRDLAPELADQVQQRAAARLEFAARQAQAPALLDSFRERNRRFLVFRFPAGERLGDRLRRQGALPQAEVMRIGLRVLEALTRLHGAFPAIIHGNLSPDTILLQPSGQVVLVGFSPALLLRDSGLPNVGSAGGARGYAAPEQLRSQADVRTDLYSLAAAMHYAVTGRDPAERAGAPGESAHPALAAVAPELNALLSTVLRPAPSQRFQSADEMRQALAGLMPRTTAAPPVVESDPPTGRHLGRVSAARLPGAAGALRAQMERVSRVPTPSRKHGGVWVALVVCVLLGALGSGALYVHLPQAQQIQATPLPASDATAAALYLQRGIGLSSGQYIFDRQRPDGKLKAQAAEALRAGHLTTALDEFERAMALDHTDAEAALYAADAALALGHGPVVTLVVGAAFGADTASSSAAEAELQGAFLAQERLNSLALLPGTTRLRIVVANSGAAPEDATTVVGLIKARISGGNPEHIVGVVGWPEAAQTRLAVAGLAGTALPIVAPAMADTAIRSPSYFALAPSVEQEASALADAAATSLQSRRVLVLDDPKISAAAALATAFITRARDQDSALLFVTAQDTYAQGQTRDFTPFAQEALNGGDDTIFIAGTALDVAALARDVAHAWPPYLPPPIILAGASANTSDLFGAGQTPVAQIVRSQMAAMGAVRVAALAATGEWSAVGVPEGVQPTFQADYAAQFGGTAPGRREDPDATAILAFDAVRLVGRAISTSAQGTAVAALTAIQAALAAIGTESPFQGVGGAIAFTGSGAPVHKALAVLSLVPVDGAPAAGDPVLTAQVVAVIGGSEAFCGGASCPLA